MKINKKNNKELICLKTGAKAKIASCFDKNNISYVKVNINIKFENSSFQVLKTFELNDIEKYFNYV